MALPATDTFLQSTGSTQSIAVYGSWAVLEGGFNVRSGVGRAEGTGGTYNTARWTADTFDADQYAIVTLDAPASATYPGPAVRCQSGANTSYHCEVDNGGTLYVSKNLAGTQSTLTTRTLSVANGDRVKLEVSGGGATVTLRVYHALAASPNTFTQLGADVTDSSSPIVTAGAAGIFQYSASTSTGIAAWEGGNLGGGGGATSVRPSDLLLLEVPLAFRAVLVAGAYSIGWFPATPVPALPILSAPGVQDITSTSARPKVTITY